MVLVVSQLDGPRGVDDVEERDLHSIQNGCDGTG